MRDHICSIAHLLYWCLFILGHDTTASAISWCLYNLANNPQHQDLARKEVENLLGDRDQIEWWVGMVWCLLWFGCIT